jgi:glycosyltransferase involved in cell wall biosynthesis
MNVLVFIHSLHSGGAERVTVHLANQWAIRGWKVTVATLASKELDFYELHPAVLRVALNATADSRHTFAAIGHNVRRLFALRRLLRQIAPNVAIGMMTTANVLLALSAVGRPGVRIFTCEHTYPPLLPVGAMWERLRRWSYPLAEKVTMLTAEGLEWLESEIPRARGVVMPNPIPYPLAVSEPRLVPSALLLSGRRLLLAVGRLSEEKSVDRLLDAFWSIAPAHPLWDLVVLGEGPLRAALEAQVQKLGLQSRVRLPGRVGNVGDWYARADLYVLSSRVEGFSNTLGEAMAHGCAAVSYDCDTGPRHIIRDGVDGLLVRPVGDVPALAAVLGALMADDDQRARMGQQAVNVRERFSTKTVLAKWDALFAEVCAQA